MLTRPQIETALSTVLDACPMADTAYRVVGTAAAVLQGVTLPASDVDVLLHARAGVDAFSAALARHECLSPPTYLDGAGQYFAAFQVHGVRVEFSTVEFPSESDTTECVGHGPWNHFVQIPCGPGRVPVVALELRLLTELARRRPDRYVPLWQFLQTRGFDADLLARGLRERGITQAAEIDLAGLIDAPATMRRGK